MANTTETYQRESGDTRDRVTIMAHLGPEDNQRSACIAEGYQPLPG